jgi:uncharacterized integral membrane protein
MVHLPAAVMSVTSGTVATAADAAGIVQDPRGGGDTIRQTCDTWGMALKYAVVAILAVAITVFALQNTAPTTVRFIVWTLDAVPLAGIVLLSVGVGLILAGVPLLITRLRHRSRVRALEGRVAELQARETPASPPTSPSGPAR